FDDVTHSSAALSLYFCYFTDTATSEIYTLSLHDALPISGRGRNRRRDDGILHRGRAPGPQGPEAPRVRAVHHRRLHGLGDDGVGDRKSTRLNSSHDQISYAVFCLKKKKDTIYYSLLRHRP